MKTTDLELRAIATSLWMAKLTEDPQYLKEALRMVRRLFKTVLLKDPDAVTKTITINKEEA